jgi:hypothetical protein
MESNMTGFYTMSDDKVAEIARIARAEPDAVRDYCTNDWPEGEEHQRWLDDASAQEIADWLPSELSRPGGSVAIPGSVEE